MKQKNYPWYYWVILGILVVILAGTFSRIHTLHQEVSWAKRNMEVAQDSVAYHKLKNGQILAERDSYILSTETMTQELNLTKSQIRELEKKLHSSWETISRLEADIRIDTIEVPVEVSWWGDSMKLNFAYSDKWVSMSGIVCVNPNNSFMMLQNMEMNLPLTIGMTEDKTFFATSENPYVQFTDITSAVNMKSLKKKKRWTVGLNVGPGVYYDALHNNIALGVGLQVGLNFNF